MVEQSDSQTGSVNAAISGDNIAVFGGSFTFNQYPSGQPPALILRLYELLGPERINTRLWYNSRHHDDYWNESLYIKARLSEILSKKSETRTHYNSAAEARSYRAAVIDIAKGLSESRSLLGTLLLPDHIYPADPYHAIANLAFQIALNIPGVAENIVEAIECVPWIHELDATTQITTLITNPLIKATAGQDRSNDWKWIVVDKPILPFSTSSNKSLTGHIITELSKESTKEKLNINIGILITSIEDTRTAAKPDIMEGRK